MFDNDECEKFMDIQTEHGQEIFQEVGRAWLQLRNFSTLVSGCRVPWHPQKQRLLGNDEIVMTLVAQLMKLAGRKPKEIVNGGSRKEDKRKRKFGEIFKQVKKTKFTEENLHQSVLVLHMLTGLVVVSFLGFCNRYLCSVE